jgi:hypothetical protein
MIKFISPKNPIHQLAPSLQEAICSAQDNAFDKAFPDAASFLGAVFDQLRIRLIAPKPLSHEDILGLMRGNVRVPEPRGDDQEAFDYSTNPFPGSDLIQPPTKSGVRLRIHQIKSKTGSAKGGDGKRLGDQLQFLSDHYDADIFYDALVGNTLIGHRSKKGVEKAAPLVRVLVGQAAFSQLTGSKHGANLLLRLYQEAFMSAAQSTGYSISEVTEGIVEYFKVRSAEAGEGFLDAILESSTGGSVNDQDSLYFNSRGR